MSSRTCENFGQPWSTDEEKQLLKLVKEGKTLYQISEEHQRSSGSIKSRLQKIAKEMYDSGKTKEEIKKLLKLLNLEEIEAGIYKQYKKPTNNDNQLLKSMNEIKSILNLLVEIELKKNNMKREDFDKVIKNNEKKSIEQMIEVVSNDSEDDEEEFEWQDSVLRIMKKYKDDPDKLRETRIKYEIPKDIFYKKVKEFKN